MRMQNKISQFTQFEIIKIEYFICTQNTENDFILVLFFLFPTGNYAAFKTLKDDFFAPSASKLSE